MTIDQTDRPTTLWDEGDYSAVGVRIAAMAEDLCEIAGILGGMRVLDVATGNGNAALCAARRDCAVVAVDTAPTLLERARRRSDAEGLDVDVRWGDAERLGFDDGSFDAVVSSVGVQFAADQASAAQELVRVCRPGGTIAMANWSPHDLWLELPAIMARHAPPPPGAASPMTWGTVEGLQTLFGADAHIELVPRTFRYHFATPERYVEMMLGTFPPFVRLMRSVDDTTRAAFRADLLDLARRWNEGGDESLSLPLTYVVVVVSTTRRRR